MGATPSLPDFRFQLKSNCCNAQTKETDEYEESKTEEEEDDNRHGVIQAALGHRGWKLQYASLIGLQLLLFKTNLNRNDARPDSDDCNGDRISLADSNTSFEFLHNEDDSSLCLSLNNTPKSINFKLPSSSSRDDLPVSVDDVESCIKIHHAFARVVEQLRYKNVFSLRLADQAEYFFKVKSNQLHTWTNSINYAAAILSAPPIIGAGQSGVYKPLLPGYLTDLDKIKQIESHETQIRNYNDSLKKLHFVNSKTRAINEPHIQFCKYEIMRFETYVMLLRHKIVDESTNDGDSVHTNVFSMLSVAESPRSEMFLNRSRRQLDASDTSSPDIPIPNRRPPKVPNIVQSSSISKTSSRQLQMSPTTDSLHSCAIPQCYVPKSKKLNLYSPQIGAHLQYPYSIGHRPMQSFSRFVEPSPVNSYSQSPLTIDRAEHNCKSPFVNLSPNKLPKYSPPSTRYHLNNL